MRKLARPHFVCVVFSYKKSGDSLVLVFFFQWMEKKLERMKNRENEIGGKCEKIKK